MNKRWLPLILSLLITATAFSQTLFTYGNYSVSVQDFMRAFNKNSLQTGTDRTTAIREYLDLYINSRLKIREAYERGYDTLPMLRNEVTNLRNQIIENYKDFPEIVAEAKEVKKQIKK